MIMTQKELDELAYLLHANAQRDDHEQIDDPAKVEESKSFADHTEVTARDKIGCRCTFNHKILFLLYLRSSL